MLRLPTTHAGKRPRANVDFHKALLRFVSSNARFARPMRPTCHADEPDRDGLCACASGEKRPSNISTNRGRTECRDRRRASRGRVGLSSPTRAVADETSATESGRHSCRSTALCSSRIPNTRTLAFVHAIARASPRTLWKSPPASRETLLTKKPTFIYLRADKSHPLRGGSTILANAFPIGNSANGHIRSPNGIPRLCRRFCRICNPALRHASVISRSENQEIRYPRRASSLRRSKCTDNACSEMIGECCLQNDSSARRDHRFQMR